MTKVIDFQDAQPPCCQRPRQGSRRGRPLRGAVISELHVPVFRASIKCHSPVTKSRP